MGFGCSEEEEEEVEKQEEEEGGGCEISGQCLAYGVDGGYGRCLARYGFNSLLYCTFTHLQ